MPLSPPLLLSPLLLFLLLLSLLLFLFLILKFFILRYVFFFLPLFFHFFFTYFFFRSVLVCVHKVLSAHATRRMAMTFVGGTLPMIKCSLSAYKSIMLLELLVMWNVRQNVKKSSFLVKRLQLLEVCENRKIEMMY